LPASKLVDFHRKLGTVLTSNVWTPQFLFGPGGSSPAHTHPKSPFIYATVLEGAIRTSVNDGPVVTYHAGQNFSEMPDDRHTLDENASKTEPANLLAVFVVATDEKELLTPIKK
jgi:quercetin dioxygenase-like cupin family protein